MQFSSAPTALGSVATNADMQTLLGRLTAGRAVNLDNLDELVSLTEARKITAGGPGGVVLPDLASVLVTDGAAGVYGSWVQLSAALATALIISSALVDQFSSSAVLWAQMQIGVGAAGSEVVQHTLAISGTRTGVTSEQGVPIPIYPPLNVLTGVRVAV